MNLGHLQTVLYCYYQALKPSMTTKLELLYEKFQGALPSMEFRIPPLSACLLPYPLVARILQVL